MICKRCEVNYNIENISKKYVEKDPAKYELCVDCRKFRLCKFCQKEFKHHQNQTCSIECSKKMKEITNIKSGGEKHNFCRNSEHRKKWQKKLLLTEGISNVFQREDVKNKIKNKNIINYGVDNPSKSDIIKSKKQQTLSKTISENPDLYKNNWMILHKKFMKEIGYDPRLQAIGCASKESLLVFNKLIDWCLLQGISDQDIYLGIEGSKEYFIKSGKSIFFYDFTIRTKKLIIEFHGTAFHVNLEDPMYEKWRHPFTGEDWKQNIKNRKIKNNKATKRGFKLLEIWSNKNPEENLEICKKFITENI